MIYFDNAATTAPIGAVQAYYNPSSPHALGIIAERAIRDARVTIAKLLDSSNGDVIFTSGGTESNNLAIIGYSLANKKQNVIFFAAAYEHPSILAPIQFVDVQGWGKAHIGSNITDGNVFVSVSHINHETGDINDIASIAADIKRTNPSAIIHVDGAQGFCKEHIGLQNVDLYSFSGHKCHAPVGTGGLWIRKGVRLTPFLHGGGQEGGMRSGTENTGAIVQMAEVADSLYHNIITNHEHVTQVRNAMHKLCDVLPDTCVNTLGSKTSPYILNMSFFGIKGEVLVHSLSEKGIYVSMGAACNSRKRAGSTLDLMGFSCEIAESAIRFSFSPYNTLEEAVIARDTIIADVIRLRKIME